MMRGAVLLLLSALAGGCASFPDTTTLPEKSDLAREAVKGWRDWPGVQKIHAHTRLTVERPNRIPEELAQISLEIEGLRGKFSDLPAILRLLDVPMMVSDPEIESLSISLPIFSGTLKEFLSSLESAYGISFSWHDGLLVAEKSAWYMISLTQSDDLSEALKGALSELGAESITASSLSNLITYKATPKAQKLIEHYLHRIALNAALITIQAAVVTVSLDRSTDVGVDWQALNLGVGSGSLLQNGTSGSTGGGSYSGNNLAGNSGSGSNSIVGSVGSAVATATGTLFGISNGGLTGKVVSSAVTLDAVIKMLSTYGTTHTSQNVSLKTMSGVPVRLRSGQEIPYVSGLSLGPLGYGGAVSNAGGSGGNGGYGGYGGLASGVRTEKVKTGLTLEMKPVFDAQSGLVTISVDMELKSLLGFIELSAGSQVGSLTQPQTQEQSFNDVVRLRAGEMAIIGGISYDSVSDNRSTLTPLEDFDMASRKDKIARNAMFIVLRPSVTLYGNWQARHAPDGYQAILHRPGEQGVVPSLDAPTDRKEGGEAEDDQK